MSSNSVGGAIESSFSRRTGSNDIGLLHGKIIEPFACTDKNDVTDDPEVQPKGMSERSQRAIQGRVPNPEARD